MANSLIYVDLGPANGGMLRNLGEGGLALMAAARLPAGELPRMRFDFPETGARVEAQGRIVWLSESGKEAGIEFEHLPDGELAKIRSWISEEDRVHERAADDHPPKNGERLNPADILKHQLGAENGVRSDQGLSSDGSGIREVSPETAPKLGEPGGAAGAGVHHDDSESRPAASSHIGQVAKSSPAVPSGVGGSNRRSRSRKKVSSLAYVDLGPANGGMLRNLGEGGLALTAATRLRAVDLPRIRFELPEAEEWIEGRGRFAWLSPTGKEAGIEFEELPASDLEKIRRWLAGERIVKSSETTTKSEVSGSSSTPSPWVDDEIEPSEAPEDVEEEVEAPAYSHAPVLKSLPRPTISGRLAAILALIALASFGAGIAIDRGFRQRFTGKIEPRGSELAVKPPVVASEPAPTEKAAAADNKPGDRNRVAPEDAMPSSQNTRVASTKSQSMEQSGAKAPQPNANSAPKQSKESVLTSKPANMPSSKGTSAAHLAPTATGAKSTASANIASNKGPATPSSATNSSPSTQRVEARPQSSPQSGPVQTESYGGPTQSGGSPRPAQTQALAATAKGSPPAATSAVSTPPPVSPSISTMVPPFPSIRVPSGLKAKPSGLGMSLEMGQLVARIEPAYPAEAVRDRTEGTVKVHASIAADGTVQSVVASGPHLLAESAMNAVRQWHYKPTRLGGQAIEADEDVVFVFRLLPQKSTPN